MSIYYSLEFKWNNYYIASQYNILYGQKSLDTSWSHPYVVLPQTLHPFTVLNNTNAFVTVSKLQPSTAMLQNLLKRLGVIFKCPQTFDLVVYVFDRFPVSLSELSCNVMCWKP